MKRLKLALVMAVLFVVGCSDRPISLWALTGQDTDIKALVGVNFDGIETGVIGEWTPADDIDWGPEPTGVGFYLGADTSWLVEAKDTGQPAPPIIDLLDGLNAVPYGRVEWLDDIENDAFGNLQPQWVAGTRFLLDDSGDVAIAVEYSDGDQAAGDVYIGMNWRF